MRLTEDGKVKVAGRTYAVHEPVFAAMKEYCETIHGVCIDVQEERSTAKAALLKIEAISDRVLEEL